MKFETLTPPEIQEIFFELKSLKSMKSFFGEKFITVVGPLLEARLVLKPTQYIASMSKDVFLSTLATCGSFRDMASRFGVSSAFIRAKHRIWLAEPEKLLSREALISELERLGSVRMLCRIKQLKESWVRRLAKEYGLNISQYLTYSFGQSEVARGRRAELWWKQIRGDSILKDLNEEEGSQADYDFDDKVWGKVNVKSSHRYRFKARCRRAAKFHWCFSSASVQKCDKVVLVFYDEKFENPLCWGVVSSQQVLSLGKKTLTVVESALTNPNPIDFQVDILEMV